MPRVYALRQLAAQELETAANTTDATGAADFTPLSSPLSPSFSTPTNQITSVTGWPVRMASGEHEDFAAQVAALFKSRRIAAAPCEEEQRRAVVSCATPEHSSSTCTSLSGTPPPQVVLAAPSTPSPRGTTTTTNTFIPTVLPLPLRRRALRSATSTGAGEKGVVWGVGGHSLTTNTLSGAFSGGASTPSSLSAFSSPSSSSNVEGEETWIGSGVNLTMPVFTAVAEEQHEQGTLPHAPRQTE